MVLLDYIDKQDFIIDVNDQKFLTIILQMPMPNVILKRFLDRSACEKIGSNF